ncbi:aquaporin Z [Nocardioides sp.]|uniref:aquaporin Z n=1 Tax=Nocardioides sp. TaxID=35761 RepID=UPI00351296FF
MTTATRTTDKTATWTTHRTAWAAEAVGTGWLVLAGCGAAVVAGDEIGPFGIALAFGLSVLTAAAALGHLSGGHFNPAVTLGLAVARRVPWREVPGYVVAQLVGATVGALTLLAIASGRPGFSAADGFATNGWGAGSPDGYVLAAVALAEIVLTAVFVLVILGVTDDRAPRGLAPVAIGLALTLIHLVSIPVDNTSVNPARSLAPALVTGGDALGQVWLFLLAPLAGAALAGLLAGLLLHRDDVVAR